MSLNIFLSITIKSFIKYKISCYEIKIGFALFLLSYNNMMLIYEVSLNRLSANKARIPLYLIIIIILI